MQSHYFTTLSILLLNVLVISCGRIEASTDQHTFSDNNSNQDGALYNPNPIGGPVSAKIYEIHPQLAFLGHYNSKFWYIERTSFNYANARGNCSSMGMSIARTDHQHELNFIFDVTLAGDLPWIGATIPMELSSFIWDGTDNEYPTNVLFTPTTTNALRFVRAPNGLSSLTPATVNNALFALCTIP